MDMPGSLRREGAFPLGRTLLVAGGGATIVALMIAGTVYLSMLGHGHSFARLMAWQLGSWGFWALVSPWVLRAGEDLAGAGPLASRLRRPLLLGILTMAGNVVAGAAAMVWLVPFHPLPPSTFRAAILSQFPAFFTIDALVLGLLLAGGCAYAGIRRARQLDLRESRLEAELARAQLDALRLEIQPHFLFNTLNSISALIRLKDHDGALRMLLGLGDLMRAAVEQPKHHLVPLSEELAFVKRYVDLQRVRFADRLQVTYDVDADCADLAVPAFMLQPLVENALRHGAAPRPGRCHVRIGARAEHDCLRLWVTDDGVGLPRGFDLGRNAGTGLSNTRSRLAQLYGSAATLDVRATQPVGTTAEIAVPAPVRAGTVLGAA